MSIVDRIDVVCGDVRSVEADLLALKYADRLFGADAAVAGALDWEGHVLPGRAAIVAGAPRIAAREVAFLGVGDLYAFRYEQIRAFGARAVRLRDEERPDARRLATTIHGVNYGLDERESFLSQIDGMVGAALDQAWRPDLEIVFVDIDLRRVLRLHTILGEKREDLRRLERDAPAQTSMRKVLNRSRKPRTRIDDRLETFGSASEEKPRLFVAMPFADEHRDEYDIAFVEAAHANGYVCERLDLEHFTGDVVREIERRIRTADGVIALLNDLNPNVFLEIGYAMALGKPIVFAVRAGTPVPFDIRNQRRIEYTRIAELRDRMRETIAALGAEAGG